MTEAKEAEGTRDQAVRQGPGPGPGSIGLGRRAPVLQLFVPLRHVLALPLWLRASAYSSHSEHLPVLLCDFLRPVMLRSPCRSPWQGTQLIGAEQSQRLSGPVTCAGPEALGPRCPVTLGKSLSSRGLRHPIREVSASDTLAPPVLELHAPLCRVWENRGPGKVRNLLRATHDAHWQLDRVGGTARRPSSSLQKPWPSPPPSGPAHRGLLGTMESMAKGPR